MTGPEIRAALRSLAETIKHEAPSYMDDPKGWLDSTLASAGAGSLQRATDAQLERLGRLLK